MARSELEVPSTLLTVTAHSRHNISDRSLLLLFGVIVGTALVAAIDAYSLSIWALEVAPIAIVLPVLWFSRTWMRFTPLLYGLIAAHCLILIVGAHWSYEHVPIGDWLNHALGWKRNNYDRLGHFAQGFVPALAAREVFIRRTELTSRRLVTFLALFVAMGASAIYEIVEMLLALTGGGASKVDNQGDIWDPEWDMFFCLCGALMSLTLLRGIHDRQIAACDDDPVSTAV